MQDNIKISHKRIITFLIASLLIAISHNLKIDWYLKDVIIPFTILLITYIYIFADKNYINKKAYYLLIPIILILISDMIIKIDWTNKLLNVLVLPFLITVFLMKLTNPNYSITKDYALWIFKLFPKDLFSNLKYLKLKRSNEKSNTSNILLGVLVGLGIGIVILCLLMSADDYFEYFINNITSGIDFDVSSIILFVGSFIVLFSIFVNILVNRKKEVKPLEMKNLDTMMVTIILSIINVVFVLFLISELSRLTINFLQLPVEYTYSSYAREGFFQLLFVTMINFTIIIYLLYKTQNIAKSNRVKYLVLLLIFFSIILIFNSYYRMFLYIGNYGLTPLRLQVILFLAMELIVFYLITKKIIRVLQNDSFKYFIVLNTFYIINLYLCNNNVIDFIMKMLK